MHHTPKKPKKTQQNLTSLQISKTERKQKTEHINTRDRFHQLQSESKRNHCYCVNTCEILGVGLGDLRGHFEFDINFVHHYHTTEQVVIFFFLYHVYMSNSLQSLQNTFRI